ncbi:MULTISPECIES: DUF397 domain-containing protein [Catenuloplanes]|uniref:DUF397 domain-containing protein n=1 Tax=Catenuloplanes TaxID=33874 RepID=UPI0035B500E2
MTQQNISEPQWRRSARCVASHHCMEVAICGALVLVRNSTRPTVALDLNGDQWRGFLAYLRSAKRTE